MKTPWVKSVKKISEELKESAKPWDIWLCRYYANLINKIETSIPYLKKDHGLISIPGLPETSLLGILARSLLSFQAKPLILLDLIRFK